MNETQPEFWLRDTVEVKDERSHFNGTVGIVRGLDTNSKGAIVYQINTDTGGAWFAGNQLEKVVDPRDVEIKRLTADVERLNQVIEPYSVVYDLWLERDTQEIDFLTWLYRSLDIAETRLAFERAYDAFKLQK